MPSEQLSAASPPPGTSEERTAPPEGEGASGPLATLIQSIDRLDELGLEGVEPATTLRVSGETR